MYIGDMIPSKPTTGATTNKLTETDIKIIRKVKPKKVETFVYSTHEYPKLLETDPFIIRDIYESMYKTLDRCHNRRMDILSKLENKEDECKNKQDELDKCKNEMEDLKKKFDELSKECKELEGLLSDVNIGGVD